MLPCGLPQTTASNHRGGIYRVSTETSADAAVEASGSG